MNWVSSLLVNRRVAQEVVQTGRFLWADTGRGGDVISRRKEGCFWQGHLCVGRGSWGLQREDNSKPDWLKVTFLGGAENCNYILALCGVGSGAGGTTLFLFLNHWEKRRKPAQGMRPSHIPIANWLSQPRCLDDRVLNQVTCSSRLMRTLPEDK